jgi:hypothetical protein
MSSATGCLYYEVYGSGEQTVFLLPTWSIIHSRHWSPPRLPRRWVRGRARSKRVLYISSPIGLGHAQRDVAIADELRKLHPGLEIDWLAQHPVTALLAERGERVHPASAHLASESCTRIPSKSAPPTRGSPTSSAGCRCPAAASARRS